MREVAWDFKKGEAFSLVGLKMPKCEIFDCSDFHDLYTRKSQRQGDFGI